ncbi:MAG TPA: hypothetical protein VIT23_07120 [Terrimicrobiaceae bacterium]
MPSLRDQLTKIFPEVLPTDPSKAINGTQLLSLVRARLDDGYSENSIRQHFSVLSADPASPIAKVDEGHGYYLRRQEATIQSAVESIPVTASQLPMEGETFVNIDESTRSSQSEEKLRAVFMRYSELNNQFPIQIEHTKGTKQRAGVNKWKFPDVVVLEWEVGHMTDNGFRLERELLEVKRSLGEQPFRLLSVELKVELFLSTFRENFFQCVSNSKWAHSAQLLIGNKISDRTLAEELRRLGTSYDVSVISYGFEPGAIDFLPSADQIRDMSIAEFESIAAKISVTRISSGKLRDTLDWEHIRDLRSQSEDFNKVFEWTAYCLEKKNPVTFRDYDKIAKVERKYA